ncbi:paraquat-inducible protein A [Endozoicomonas sp. SCSIO W0465]|uniref:paraquat-inducible protein A n=1 Tax=Endozoicomonas sp. SCSIO W0465 TaxID=2918516 RepID=UPI00207578EC|nr:paraquat-inducible protein A [Endozoicomonas sp. SCSIO W0465]USE39040.1 paraquat-inducible protein A [Endozoicomonas sp. SCSIO W0465]
MIRQTILLPLMMIISLFLLISGVTQPMMTIKANLDRQAMLDEGKHIIKQQNLHPAMANLAAQFLDSLEVKGKSTVYEKKRSILGTAEDLWKSDYYFVAFLIVTFSLIIPFTKLGCLLLANFVKRNHNLLRLNSILSKWSMADVFAIGVFIAFLAANATTTENIDSSQIVQFDATLHSGFYWFVAYCLVSNLMEKLGVNQPEATPAP